MIRKSFQGLLAIPVLAAIALIASCQKYSDQPGGTDDRLKRRYCNDPEAVNYNLDFPGTEDNTVCYYPADVFAGTYTYTDSVYSSGASLVQQVPLVLTITGNTRKTFDVAGFCSGSVLHFTGNRALLATADTTITLGQSWCRLQDTVSGTLARKLGDSSRLRIDLMVVSDTGTTRHRGTAYRQ